MKPRRRRRIVRPRILRPGVIGYVVDQDFHASLVRVGNQRLILLHAAHVLVERVEVDDVIAVIVGIGVLPDWSEPKSVDAEIVQVGEMLVDAAQIAAVIDAGIAAIADSGRPRWMIVGQIPVGETVGHDEVDDIVRGETLVVPGRIATVPERKLNLGRVFLLRG